MSRTTADKSDARSRMITAAFDLFHQKGVSATSVDEILAHSGTGKSQFSHYFKNKEGLLHACLQHFLDQLKNGRLPVNYELDSWEDLEAWFGFFIGFQNNTGCRRGCPVATIASDLEAHSEVIRQDLKMLSDFTQTKLARFFDKMKARGELSAAADPDALADYCYSIMQGGLAISKMNGNTAAFERAAAQAMAHLRSLSP
ncbi:MAG: TetR/AcrR family transcriptional regulator [Candidatus Omnitrophica bacterium]|nr:TetR/AcrR family transcriptional regulator [Candidatus Omnitrophota bacterium]MCB9719258.1 TetR/AcrR family transcriptional regulator [Candidatus Omnitrophota bacterium]